MGTRPAVPMGRPERYRTGRTESTSRGRSAALSVMSRSRTAAVRECTSCRAKTRSRCVRTVRTDIPRCVATCLSAIPSAINSRTTRSRGERWTSKAVGRLISRSLLSFGSGRPGVSSIDRYLSRSVQKCTIMHICYSVPPKAPGCRELCEYYRRSRRCHAIIVIARSTFLAGGASPQF